jgi:hypothetical protein
LLTEIDGVGITLAIGGVFLYNKIQYDEQKREKERNKHSSPVWYTELNLQHPHTITCKESTLYFKKNEYKQSKQCKWTIQK